MKRTGRACICLGLIIALGILYFSTGPSLAQNEGPDLDNQILKGPPIALSPEYYSVLWMVDHPNLSVPLRVNHLAPENCVGDVNYDGILDIIFVESSDNLICLDGASGELLWRSDIKVNHYRSVLKCVPSMIDIEGDGDLEVVVGAAYGRLAFLDASTGELEHSVLLGNVATKPNAIDLDGDGYLDIVVGIYSPAPSPTVACLSGRTHTPLWTYNGTTPVVERMAISDVDGDGRMEIIVVEADSRIVCLTGVNGTIEWTSDRLSGIDTFPIVADLDADNVPEIVVAGYQIYVLRGSDGELIRSIDVNHVGYLLVGDLDTDEDLEILVVQIGFPRSLITIIDGDSYEEINDVPASFSNWYLRDLDGDNIDEVIVSDGYTRIYAYYPYHDEVEMFSKNHTLESIVDVDDDGYSEVLVSDGESLSLLRSNDPDIGMKVDGLAEGGLAYPDHLYYLELDVLFQTPEYIIERIEVQLGHGSQWLTLAFDGNGTDLVLEDDLSGTVSVHNTTAGPPGRHHGILLRTQLIFAWDCPLRDWIDASMVVVYNDGAIRDVEYGEVLRIEYGIHLAGEPSLTVTEGVGPIDGKWVSNGSTVRLQGILVVHDGPMGPLVESIVFGIVVEERKDVVLSIDRGGTSPELDITIEVIHMAPGNPIHNLTLRLSQTVPGCVPGSDVEIELLVDDVPPLISDPEPQEDSWLNSTWLRCTIWAEDPIGPGVDPDGVKCRIAPRDGTADNDWAPSMQIQRDGDLGKYEVVILLPEDGPYTIQWSVMDLLGNRGTILSYQVNRDTDPPLLEPFPFEYWANIQERTFRVNTVDEGIGIDHSGARFRMSDNTNSGWGWTDVVWEDGTTAIMHGKGLSSGEFELVMDVADKVGNRASIILQFGVDLEPPTLQPDVPGIINITGSLVEIVVDINDPGNSGIGPAGLEFAKGERGANWTPVPMHSIVSDGVVTIRFQLDADSLLWLRGTDLAGNPTDVIGPFDLNLNEPPWVDVSRPLDEGSYDNPVVIDGTASIDPEGLALDYIWILDGTRLEGGKPFDDIKIQKGTHLLILEVDDGFHTNRSSPIEFEVIEVISPIRSPFTIALIVLVVLAILTTVLLLHNRKRDDD